MNCVKIITCFVVLLSAVFLFPQRAWAQETQSGVYDASGAQGLYDGLEEEAKDLLGTMGVEGAQIQGEWDGEGLWSALSQLVQDKLYGPIQALAALLAVVILCRLATSFEQEEVGLTCAMVGTMVCGAVLVVPLLSLMESARLVVDSCSVFLLSAVPIYAALMIAAGNGITGASYSFWTLGVGNLIPLLSSALIFPVLHLFLAFGISSAISKVKFQKLTSSLYSFLKWVLILLVTVFSGVLSVQTLINSQVDAATSKTVKLLASSAIPIVGGAFGDALAAIQGSVQIVKSGVGAFGVLASLCIFLPVALECLIWSLVAHLGEIAADVFEVPQLSSLMGVCSQVAKMVLAVVVSTGAVSIVCAAVVLFVKSALG